MADTYQMVTDRIISELEAGYIPWHRPWCSVNAGAFNRVSGRQYSLLNQMMLKHSGEYASFNQWKKLGGYIRKGEKSEFVVFWKWQEEAEEPCENEDEKETKETISDERKRHPILKFYRVFHISQVDGVEPLAEKQELFDTDPIEEAERLFAGYVEREGIRLDQELSNKAYYSPASDGIHLPCIQQYERAEEFYSTAFHECIHSSGHETRLNRPGLQEVAFGSEIYSKEELVAEIGSACIMNMLGIETEASFRNSTAYIQGWLKALQSDRRMIVSAASQAEKAVKFILGEPVM